MMERASEQPLSEPSVETPVPDTGAMPQYLIVLLDDHSQRRESLTSILEFVEQGAVHSVGCADWENALADADSILTVIVGDSAEPGIRDDILSRLRDDLPEIPAFLLREGDSVPAISRELAMHILGYIEIPARYDNVNEAFTKARIYRENRGKRDIDSNETLFRSLVGNSRAIRKVRRLMEQVAGSDANVLIFGESGSGKEVVARNLHYHSSRRDMPFVPINCGAIPPDLLESELFGHEKGAFTGAITSRQGRFEMARGGTLFLDEIGDMPLSMQVKLLRVLQERTFERVGSNTSLMADVRIIAATHNDLEAAIEQGTFREDLYYRLNVFPIEMPPLRERISDIPLLINELITRFEHEKRGSVRMTPATVISLCQYPWPGNVRELANLVERLVILYPYGVIDVMDLPEKFRVLNMEVPDRSEKEDASLYENPLTGPRLPREGLDLKDYLADMERTFIRQALEESDNVVAHAAKLLKMRRTTLVEKMRKYGLQRGSRENS